MKGIVHKILASKYWWIMLLAGVILINYLATFLQARIDLTREKIYPQCRNRQTGETTG
ncbi:MAG: hypothetical protein IPP99_02350 [Chitinophagaceae bacterium]|nr:hypothetical protein [Chitinophagaceae bacterium]